MNNSDFEQRLRQQLDKLPREHQPERDLWQGIEHAIHQPEETSSPKWWRNVAAVAMVGIVSWSGVQWHQQRQAPEHLVTQLAQSHQQQKTTLLARFEEQPALTDNWQSQLAELEQAADAIKQALQEDPDNMALLKMLQQVYQQQIDLIEKVHAPRWRQI